MSFLRSLFTRLPHNSTEDRKGAKLELGKITTTAELFKSLPDIPSVSKEPGCIHVLQKGITIKIEKKLFSQEALREIIEREFEQSFFVHTKDTPFRMSYSDYEYGLDEDYGAVCDGNNLLVPAVVSEPLDGRNSPLPQRRYLYAYQIPGTETFFKLTTPMLSKFYASERATPFTLAAGEIVNVSDALEYEAKLLAHPIVTPSRPR